MDRPLHLTLDEPGSAGPATFRRSAVIAAVIVVLAVTIMGAGRIQLPPYPQFTLFHATFSFVVDLVTAFLLFGQFVYCRVRSYLLLAAAFLFSALVMVPFLLSFPGAVAAKTLLIGGPQSAIWTWHFWHILFPALIGASVLLHRRVRRTVEERHVPAAVAVTITLVILSVAAVLAAVTLFHDRLPVLYAASEAPLTPSFYVTGGVAAAVTLLALALTLPHVRQRSVLHIWIAMVLLALLVDVGASLSAYDRYSVGWYFGRIEAMLASSVLVVLLLSDISRLYRSLAETAQALAASSEQQDRLLAEVRRREQEFEALAENSTDIIARFDRNLRRVYVNSAIEAVLKRPREEILGKTHFGVGLPQPVAAELDAELRTVLASGRPRTVENTVPTPAGERHLHSHLIPEFGAGGEVESVVVISRDLTERVRAEEAVRESERKYRELVENLYEGIWLIDDKANTTFVNARMAELLGYPEEEMLGRPLFYFMRQPAAEAARGNLERGQAGVKAEYDFEFRCKDGRPIWTHIVTTPLFDKEGVYRGALAGLIDITGRKRMEEALSRANAELQQFAYVASHDLKAPLRTVSNLCTWLEEDLGPQLSGEVRRHLQLMRERIARMDALIEGLLACSRAGGTTREVERVDSGLVAKEVLNAHPIPETLHVSVSGAMPLLVTDRIKIEQVFANLISNAIKYHDRHDGHVWVSARESEGDYYEFTVADDGPGIPAEYHERIFKLLQRGPTAEGREGTGMGLAVVKKLVEGVGGRITVESSPGEGASFRFTWPKRMDVKATEAT